MCNAIKFIFLHSLLTNTNFAFHLNQYLTMTYILLANQNLKNVTLVFNSCTQSCVYFLVFNSKIPFCAPAVCSCSTF